MTPGSFQFTLRRMFVATAYVSLACALAAFVFREEETLQELASKGAILMLVFWPFYVGALLGAGVGEICGDAFKGAMYGFLTGFVFRFLLLAGVLARGILLHLP
jgi:hypothetical protein